MTNLAKPKVGMLVSGKRNGALYYIQEIHADQVRLVPKWTGNGSRTTWKSIARLWNDYVRIDV